MAWKNNHPYIPQMTLADMHTMVAANDKITHTSLACPDCGEGHMCFDLEPIQEPAPTFAPALVCTTCGYATSANHAIYGPRDTTGNRG